MQCSVPTTGVSLYAAMGAVPDGIIELLPDAVPAQQQGGHQLLHVQELADGPQGCSQGWHACAVQHGEHREERPEHQGDSLLVGMPPAGWMTT